MLKQIVLLRHALTNYHIVGSEGKFCGLSDPPLNQLGIDQLPEISYALEGLTIESIYSSPLKRCIETAEYIARQRDIKIMSIDHLKEINYGQWEGLSKSEVLKKWPDRYSLFNSNPINYGPPEGENGLECLKRIKEWLLTLNCDKIFAVSHKTIIRLLICDLLCIDPIFYRSAIDIKIGGIMVLKLTDSGWRLEALNYGASHHRVYGR